MSAQIILPRILQVGKGASLEVASIVVALGCKKPLLVTDKTMLSMGYAETIQQCLAAQSLTCGVYSVAVQEPTANSVMTGVEQARSQNYDCVIALGGGSSIDSAKAISVLARYGGHIRDYKFPRLVDELGLPVIAIPTTAGSGSEVTRFAIITDEVNDEKMLCTGMGFMPFASLVDFNLSMTVPPRVTADTGLDALTHAIESYVSKKANAYSASQAIEAMRLIGPNIRGAYHDGSNETAREAMMLGATLAGVAFSNASVALVHGMSRPLGAFFHVPHGLSNAMLLPMVTRYSLPSAGERYADCARAIGVAVVEDSTESANKKLLDELEALNVELRVPSPKAFGIDRTAFMDVTDIMAEQALASGSPANNPRAPSKNEIIAMYEALWL